MRGMSADAVVCRDGQDVCLNDRLFFFIVVVIRKK